MSDPLENVRAAMKPMFDELRRRDAEGYNEAMADLASLGVTVDWIGGNCPVQAEGSISESQEFYFRARGDEWQFHIFAAGTGPFDDDEWVREEGYGSGFDAGWMPQGEALRFIADSVRAYRARPAEGTMTRAQVMPERIRADRAASILGVDTKTLKQLSDRRLVPEAALLGSIYTYREAALLEFLPHFQANKAQLIESLKPARVDTVYVIRCGYRVKIGFTKNIAQRLHSLKTANHRPIELLTSWAAPQSEEKALHSRFAGLRVSGEWFALQKPIKEWLREVHGVELR